MTEIKMICPSCGEDAQGTCWCNKCDCRTAPKRGEVYITWAEAEVDE